MLRDLRFGFRMLRRSAAFSLLVIFCLTLGIGATTAAMSWIEGILLRPFPMVPAQDRMMALTGIDRSGTRTDISWPDLQDLRRNCRLVEAIVAEHIAGATLNIGERADRAAGSVVSANYFAALGVRPLLGRTFEPAEDVGRNAHPVAVISYQAWNERYGRDPRIIGRKQRLNGVEHTIVGVMPEGFYGTFVGYGFQFWVPASMEDTLEGGGYKLESRAAQWIEGFAILKPGVTRQQAQAEMAAVGKRLEAAYPEMNRGRGFRLFPLWQTPFNNAGTLLPTLRISLVVACLVLFIACANVANLLLVRSFARQQEMTVRLAIGAGRWRLLRQLLTEGWIISAAAAGGGLLVAYWCRNLMTLLFPPTPAGILIHLPAQTDWRVLLLSAGVCLLAALLFGAVPAMHARKIDLAAAMKSEAHGVVGGRGKAWIRSGLVLVQVSLSFTLLVGVALLVKSLHAMRQIDVGFAAGEVLTGSVDLAGAGYEGPRLRSFQDQFTTRVSAMPGVESVAWSRSVPFTNRGFLSAPVAVEGYIGEPGERPLLEYDEVGPGYLATMGIPLHAGREFTAADNENTAPVAVVNQTMVDRFWRGQDPVGKRLQVDGRWARVVGVARTAKYGSLLEPPKPFFYLPLRQSAPGGSNFQIRARLGQARISSLLARQVKGIDPDLAPGETITMREQVDRRSWSRRAAVTLLSVFGSVALLLAAIGLYGVMSYAVSQNTREFGLRMALGATVTDLQRGVVGKAMGLTLAGIALGGAFALLSTRLMGDMLYQVGPRDPAAFAAAFLLMTAAACAASWFPARRASRVDPIRALRGA